MKRLLILALCGGCTFGLDTTAETLDQGGIRVTPTRIDLDNGSETLVINEVQFRNTGDIFSEEGPQMVLDFEYEGHAIEFEAFQVERLTAAGGHTRLRVDGEPQIVEVTSSAAGRVDTYGGSDAVELRFAFRPEPNAEPVLAVVVLDASFHCPPFDTRPAEVEGQTIPIL